MRLNELSPAEGSRHRRKRVGRGNGSSGTYSGRGCNGQNSRSGGSVRPGYEGGQMPIHRRLPKRGFTNIFKKEYAIVNIGELSRFESGSVVDEKALIQKGLVNGKHDGIKVLGKGDINCPLTIIVDKVSSGAREKVEAAGGTIEVK
jgi:large subunit ribosomal protein L15